jgi:flagellar hook-basal body complex protein FliE
MPTIDSTRLLMELRSLAQEAQRAPSLGAAGGTGAGGPAAAPDFGALLKESLNQVNSLQQGAQELSAALEQGQPGLDITRVMVEAQKASLAFRAMTEVRNRLVSAYQDVMNMAI